MIDIKDYYLNIKGIFLIEKDKYEMIFSLYNQMCDHIRSNESSLAQSMFNTLVKNGYLINKTTEEREEKIGLING